MKRYVHVANMDLFTVQQRLSSMLEAQYTELRSCNEGEKLPIRHSHRIPIFSNLVGKVLHYALFLALIGTGEKGNLRQTNTFFLASVSV
jgi:hypothetical protein